MSRATNSLPSADNRPAKSPWTPEQLKHFAECRARNIQRAKDRTAKKAVKVEARLATANDLVCFTRDGDTVTISHTHGPYLKRETVSLDQARAEYRRLLKAGYYVW